MGVGGRRGTRHVDRAGRHPAGFDAAQVPQLLRDVFTAAGGTHDDWDEYDRVMAEERRLAVLVDPIRISSNG